MPMTAAGTPGKFTFVSHDKAAPTAFLEDLLGRELEI